jgi:DNA-binding SARP family transcriptional activator/pimeloyl-ACP methyl ester carboxylesterase
MDAEPRVQVLGAFIVEFGRMRCAEGDWPKAAAGLVKLLAVEPGGRMTRDHAIATLWPGVDPTTGSSRLYKALHHLRQLGNGCEPLVKMQNATVSLSPEVTIDLAEFRAAATRALSSGSEELFERALSLYSGTLLPDDTYEEWTLRTREEVMGLAQELRVQLGRRYVETDRPDRAEAVLHEAIQIDDCNEDAHLLLMQIFARRGDVDRALAQYEVCSAALRDSLGTEPRSDVREAWTRLREGATGDVDAQVPCPELRFVTTPDGCRLAYQVFGSGPPLVHMSQLCWNDLVREWEIPAWQAFHRKLGRGRTLVRYDSRGMGQSDREVERLTVDDIVCDLLTVVDEIGLDTFDLYTGIHSCLAGIKFAALRPERVRRLVMLGPYVRPADMTVQDGPSAGLNSASLDWDWYCRNGAAMTLGFEHHEVANQLGQMMVESSSAEFVGHVAAGYWTEDLTEYLPQLRMPVLCLHPPQPFYDDIDAEVRALTAQIPDGRLALLPDCPMLPIVGDTDGMVAVVHSFLDEE